MAITQKKAHILQVVGEPIGGIRKHIHSILECLNYETFLFSYAYSNTLSDSRFQAEIIRIEQNIYGTMKMFVKKKPHPSDISNIWKLMIYVKKNDVDVLHGNGAKGGLYARIVGRLCNVPAFYTPHGGVAHRMFGKWEDKLYTLVEKALEPITHCYIFESNYTATSFFSKVGNTRRPWIVNHNGIECYQPIRSLGHDIYSEGIINICVVGTLRREKGQAFLVAALPRAIKLGQKDIRLHILGDGPDRKDLEHQVTQLELNGIVTFHGDIANPEVEMLKTGMVVIPSLFESFGYVGLEAMALGIPVIASATGGLLEIFNEDCALMVPPADSVALGDAIIQLSKNESLREKFVANGMNRCESLFSLSRMNSVLASQYLDSLS